MPLARVTPESASHEGCACQRDGGRRRACPAASKKPCSASLHACSFTSSVRSRPPSLLRMRALRSFQAHVRTRGGRRPCIAIDDSGPPIPHFLRLTDDLEIGPGSGVAVCIASAHCTFGAVVHTVATVGATVSCFDRQIEFPKSSIRFTRTIIVAHGTQKIKIACAAIGVWLSPWSIRCWQAALRCPHCSQLPHNVRRG